MADRVLFASKQNSSFRRRQDDDLSPIAFLTDAREVLVKQKNQLGQVSLGNRHKTSEIMLQSEGEQAFDLPVDKDEAARAERLGLSQVTEPAPPGSVQVDLVSHATVLAPQPAISKAGAKRGRRASLVIAAELESQQIAVQGLPASTGRLLPALTGQTAGGSTPRDGPLSAPSNQIGAHGKKFGFLHSMPRAIGGYKDDADAADPLAAGRNALKSLEESDLTFLAVQEQSRAGQELERLRRKIEGRKDLQQVMTDHSSLLDTLSTTQDVDSEGEEAGMRGSKSEPPVFLPLLRNSSTAHRSALDGGPATPATTSPQPAAGKAPSGFSIPRLDLKSMSSLTGSPGGMLSSRDGPGTPTSVGTPLGFERRKDGAGAGTPRSRAGLPTTSNITPRSRSNVANGYTTDRSPADKAASNLTSPGSDVDFSSQASTPRGASSMLPGMGRLNTSSKLGALPGAGTPRGGLGSSSNIAQAMANTQVSSTPRGLLGKLKDIFQPNR